MRKYRYLGQKVLTLASTAAARSGTSNLIVLSRIGKPERLKASKNFTRFECCALHTEERTRIQGVWDWGLGRVFGCKGWGEVTGGSRVFIIKFITAYFYADKWKEVEVIDTG